MANYRGLSLLNIVMAYQARARSDNWAAWVGENPILAELLAEAERLVND